MASDSPDTPLSPAAVARSGLCIGCGACASERAGVRMAFDAHGQYKPGGAGVEKAGPGFARTCPFSPSAPDEDLLSAALFPECPSRHAAVGRFLAAYVGHAAEADFRAQGSSGGLVSWVLTDLLRRGLIDGAVHVGTADARREGRLFRYRVSRTEDEIRAGAKSRYYPVEMSGVLSAIRETPGRYAVVGVPCFIKAVQLLRREESLLKERIVFTLGLFCGHMKSARFVDSLAWQMGVSPERVVTLDFRRKDPARPASTYTAALTLAGGEVVRRDWWNMPDGDWGAGFFQNSACNFCDDVVAETADMSFGDAWVEPYAADGRGTNVVVVRSPLLARLVSDGIADGRLRMTPVDGEFVARTQAAGLRQRREGLAYRLTWRRFGLAPRKRLAPGADGLPLRRKLIYRARALISAGSHPVFRLAQMLRLPWLYLRWARLAVAIYHGLAYSRGPLGRLLERLGFK